MPTTELPNTDPAPIQTPSQTVGPFFGFALPVEGGPELVAPGHPGAIRLHGAVLDGGGDPVPDALVELWQRGADGAVPHEPGGLNRRSDGFTGFGRAPTDPDGRFAFRTVRPDATADGPSWALVTVFARGLLHHLFTRAYFVAAGEPDPDDPLLRRLPPDRRGTLLAREDGADSYRFDIRLQGADETVFLDYPGGGA